MIRPCVPRVKAFSVRCSPRQQIAASAAASAAEVARAAEAQRAQETENRVSTPVVAAPVAATPAVVAANTLKLVRSSPTVYPQRALEDLVSGWVELEFTVGRDGAVKDITVVNAEPRRTFDNAALARLGSQPEPLRQVAEIARFLRWIAGKPADFHARTARRR